jgi:iron complex transport system substrate-binding protein
MTRRVWLWAIVVATIAACSRGEAPAMRLGGARRIVSLNPSTTEVLFAIGAGDRVVGRSRYCDYPPEAAALPVVGDVEPNLEAILELEPDLVVALGGVTSERLAEKLGARGIPTWFAYSNSLKAIDGLVVGLGERAGHAEAARRLVDRIDARERAIERSVAGEPRPRVLMVVSVAPVVVAGPKSFAAELIRLGGGENVIVDGEAWPAVGFERILELDPDVVVDATDVTSGAVTRITVDAPGWGGVRAVREGHVVTIRDEQVLRAGPRIADGLAVLARAIHPGVAVP